MKEDEFVEKELKKHGGWADLVNSEYIIGSILSPINEFIYNNKTTTWLRDKFVNEFSKKIKNYRFYVHLDETFRELLLDEIKRSLTPSSSRLPQEIRWNSNTTPITETILSCEDWRYFPKSVLVNRVSYIKNFEIDVFLTAEIIHFLGWYSHKNILVRRLDLDGCDDYFFIRNQNVEAVYARKIIF